MAVKWRERKVKVTWSSSLSYWISWISWGSYCCLLWPLLLTFTGCWLTEFSSHHCISLTRSLCQIIMSIVHFNGMRADYSRAFVHQSWCLGFPKCAKSVQLFLCSRLNDMMLIDRAGCILWQQLCLSILNSLNPVVPCVCVIYYTYLPACLQVLCFFLQ